MGRTTTLLLALTLAACHTACAATDLPGTQSFLRPATPPDGRLHVALEPVVRTAPVSGFWQTPRGGKVGTTSIRRPTFTETGVTESVEVGASARLDYGRHRAEVSYARQDLSGDSTPLAQDLVSQASTFPAGTTLRSDSAIDWVSARYSYLFELPLGSADHLELRPGVGYRFVGLHHVLEGSNGARVSRHHAPTMPDLSLDWAWHPRHRGALRFSGRVGHSLNNATDRLTRKRVFEALARAHYDLGPRGSVFLEMGYRSVELRDDQPDRQNHLDLEFGPWIGLGGELKL